MPRYEFGWFVKKLYFSKEETEDVADGAAAAALAVAVIPDPVVSKVLALYVGLIALGAKRAKKKGKALGMKWYAPGPIPLSAPHALFFHNEDV